MVATYLGLAKVVAVAVRQLYGSENWQPLDAREFLEIGCTFRNRINFSNYQRIRRRTGRHLPTTRKVLSVEMAIRVMSEGICSSMAAIIVRSSMYQTLIVRSLDP